MCDITCIDNLIDFICSEVEEQERQNRRKRGT